MIFLVIGAGSIGERHTKNLLSLGQTVMIYDKDFDKMQRLVDKYKVEVYDFLSQHIKIDAFVICTPPNMHIPFAEEAIKHNSHMFIEKPLTHNMDGVNELIRNAKDRNLAIQVGYQLRFDPGLIWIKGAILSGQIGKLQHIKATYSNYLPNWHPGEDYRDLYTGKKSEGGGIILDSSHEIDYVMWLVESEVSDVKCLSDKFSDLDIDVEDTAEILLTFENGVIANISLHMGIEGEPVRTCIVSGSKGSLTWDYFHKINNAIVSYENGAIVKYSSNDSYLDEMASFVSLVRHNGQNPEVSIQEAKKVLEVALKCKEGSPI